MRVEVQDEILHELQEVIHEGPQTKNDCPLSQKPGPVRPAVVMSGGQPGQVEDEVEEEQAGDDVEVAQQVLHLRPRGVQLGVAQLVGDD